MCLSFACFVFTPLAPDSQLLRFATGLFLNRFFAVQLSRCIRLLTFCRIFRPPFGFLPILSFSAYGQSLFHFWNRALKTIQTKLCNLLNSFSDALCVLRDRRSGLRTRILMLRCCCSSFDNKLRLVFALLALGFPTFVRRIDLGMSSGISSFAVSLERR